MAKKTIVVTGASDGIGAAAARSLVGDGHSVVVVGRSRPKTEAIARELGADHLLADFAELDSVRSLAADLLERYPRIDVLANNAGGIFGDRRESTADGHERTFQVNYLAPFLLTQLLTERLIESRATVINTSSAANRLFGQLDIDDLESERSYSATRAYGSAKLAQILHAKELDRRFGERGLSAVSFHPGVIATSFSTAPGSAMRLFYATPLKHLFTRGPKRGADTLVWLAKSVPGRDWTPGGYFVKRKPARAHEQVQDAALAAELWRRSEGMLAPTR